jgi:Zn-dependent M16 (insulinase) family peptidase
MKWLKDDSYNAMKQAADNWDKLLNKVLGDNPDMKAEDVTVDQLLDSTGNTSDLQEQLSTAQEKLKEKDTQIEQLQSDVAELKGTPAGKKPEAKVKQEPTAETGDIKDFADKHEDDTLAIMAEAEKTGFFKH